ALLRAPRPHPQPPNHRQPTPLPPRHPAPSLLHPYLPTRGHPPGPHPPGPATATRQPHTHPHRLDQPFGPMARRTRRPHPTTGQPPRPPDRLHRMRLPVPGHLHPVQPRRRTGHLRARTTPPDGRSAQKRHLLSPKAPLPACHSSAGGSLITTTPGQGIGTLIPLVSAVATYPVPLHLVSGGGLVQPLPQVHVLDRFFGRGLPLAALPIVQPGHDAITHIGGVGVQRHR